MQRMIVTLGVVGFGIVIGALLFGKDVDLVARAQADGDSPTKALQKREVYYPGTEDLAPDEISDSPGADATTRVKRLVHAEF